MTGCQCDCSVPLAGHPEHDYHRVTPEQLERVRQQHSWIVGPIEKASDLILEMPFFSIVNEMKSVHEFKRCATQLWYHSATFPKVMGLMLGLTPLSENSMMEFYSAHAYGEATHHEMLMQWMLKHGLLNDRKEIEEFIPTLETNACVNLAYQMAIEQHRNKWLACLNSGIERCSNQFFKVVSKKMHELGAGDAYFDVHVEADEHHSIMGLEYLTEVTTDQERDILVKKALEGISLWAAMLHSWVDISALPHFNRDGSLVKGRRTISF